MSQAEGKAAHLAQQLKDLKAQKAAAESRNVILEKVFELQGLHSLDKDKFEASHAGSSTAAVSNQASTSGNSGLLPYSLGNPIHCEFEVETMIRARSEQPPLLQFSQAELEALDWAEFARLWKEYISRWFAIWY